MKGKVNAYGNEENGKWGSYGRLLNGYDYKRQAWALDGKYIRCGHVVDCDCYGRLHAGEKTQDDGQI